MDLTHGLETGGEIFGIDNLVHGIAVAFVGNQR